MDTERGTGLRERLEDAPRGTYTLERELGGGGMSRVFLAEETRFGRRVVVKALAPELAEGLSAERFEREIRLAARLQHPNVVPVLAAGVAGGVPYYTMPYVEGESLRARLARDGRLPAVEAVAILRDVARALAYAHSHGVVHRDIKPENVLLAGGAAAVADFGVAKALHVARTAEAMAGLPGQAPTGTLTGVGASVGTPAYMAPEQAAGDPDVDARADLYAWGVVAYELLAGHPPFTGPPQRVMAAHVTAPPPPLPGRPDLPPGLARAVMRCLAKAPGERYPTAEALLAALDDAMRPARADPLAGRRRTRVALTAGIALLSLALAAWVGGDRWRRRRWTRGEAIPRIARYVELAQYDSAWTLARRARTVLPRDSTLAALWPQFSARGVLHSRPEGAQVFFALADDTTHWTPLGTTPTDTLDLPLAFGRVRVERPGFRPHLALLHGRAGSRTLFLDRADAADADMARVSGGTFNAFLVGLDGSTPLRLGDFLMDRREVTNREYKAFVDAGGHRRRELWPATFTDGGRPVRWDSAVGGLTDRTGRPGPATWEAGTYPSGQGDVPVGGVSWYEAAAYARFRGKSLPTVYHWARAARIQAARYVVPGSNFAGAGPVRGNTSRGLSYDGVFDLAGNVREWCENAAGADERYILGGGWTDQPYAFTDAYAQPALDRSPVNGIRLVRYLQADTALARARAPQVRAFRDYATERPADDATFASFLPFFDYDRTPLDARLERRDTTSSESWTVEQVSFAAAYGGERVLANVYVPRRGRPPYQPVVFFPGSSGMNQKNSLERPDLRFEFLVKSGRLGVVPVLKSTYERRDSLRSDIPNGSIFWRDHVVMWDKDVRRTIDYLAARPDVDTARVGYFGASWGANQAPIVLATEPRIKAAVLYVAGLTMERGRPEVDPLNFLPRVRVPVLMLNGRYDYYFPVERSQRPFFRWLGTPPDRKQYRVYDGGHDVPREALIAQSLAWFDRYLGPVR